MSLPKVRTHKNYQEFVKEQLAPGKIEIPIIFRNVFIKLFHLDLSPVSLILKNRYSHQGPSARDPQDMLRSLLTMTLLGVTFIDEWVVLFRSFPSFTIISGLLPD